MSQQRNDVLASSRNLPQRGETGGRRKRPSSPQETQLVPVEQQGSRPEGRQQQHYQRRMNCCVFLVAEKCCSRITGACIQIFNAGLLVKIDTQDVLFLSRPRKIPTTGRYHTLRLLIGCRNRVRVRGRVWVWALCHPLPAFDNYRKSV